jgi:hypothetical protein
MFSILLVNSAGFYVYYIFELQRIRTEMREQLKFLPEHELDVLDLSQNEFIEAQVEEHEVMVDGKMYDIARIESVGGRIKVFCVHDELEDNFLALFAELVSKPIEDTSSIPTTVVAFIQMSFVLNGDTIEFKNSFVQVTPGFSYLNSAGISITDIQTPPPKA